MITGAKSICFFGGMASSTSIFAFSASTVMSSGLAKISSVLPAIVFMLQNFDKNKKITKIRLNPYKMGGILGVAVACRGGLAIGTRR
jgi:hypothetical protein